MLSVVCLHAVSYVITKIVVHWPAAQIASYIKPKSFFSTSRLFLFCILSEIITHIHQIPYIMAMYDILSKYFSHHWLNRVNFAGFSSIVQAIVFRYEWKINGKCPWLMSMNRKQMWGNISMNSEKYVKILHRECCK